MKHKTGEVPMTNGEYIRSLSDEALVEKILNLYTNESDTSILWCDGAGGCDLEDSDCTEEMRKNCILRWLRKQCQKET